MLGTDSSKFVSVNVAFADLRKRPVDRLKGIGEKDLLQESQCLYGEVLEVVEEWKDWLHVSSLSQVKRSDQQIWKGYPGWIKKFQVCSIPEEIRGRVLFVTVPWASIRFFQEKGGEKKIYLPLGARLLAKRIEKKLWKFQMLGGYGLVSTKEVKEEKDLLNLSETKKRKGIVDIARCFLGNPYFWGGRATYHSQIAPSTSVDCSSLVNLSYLSQALYVPRNAHDQFLFCKCLSPLNLQEGDLIFLAKQSLPNFIEHVMIYEGKGFLLEATEDSKSVCRRSLEDRLGFLLKDLKEGDLVKGGKLVYFGSFLHSKNLLKKKEIGIIET